MLLPLIGAGLGGYSAYQQSEGNLGATLLGAGLGAVAPAGLRMAGTALGTKLAGSALANKAGAGLMQGATSLGQAVPKIYAPGTLGAQAANVTGSAAAQLSKGGRILSSPGLSARLLPGMLGTGAVAVGGLFAPQIAGALASKVAPAGQATGQAAANLAANALGYPQGYGQDATYNEAAINAGLTPSGYVDAYGTPLDIGNPLGTAAGRRLEYAKNIEQQRAAMQMLGPEIYKAKEAAARQELQRQLTAAGVRENIATQGAMLRQAQLGAQQVGAQAASQMGSALTQQYQYS